MGSSGKPVRLGRGLDALLARRAGGKSGVDSNATGSELQHTNVPANDARRATTGDTPAALPTSPARTANTAMGGEPAAVRQPNAHSNDRSDSAYAAPHQPREQSTQDQDPTTPRSPYGNAGSLHPQSPRETSPADHDPTTRAADTRTTTTAPDAPSYRLIPVEEIATNPFQPRKEFHPQDLADLEASLRSQGLLQPITVRPSPQHAGYELIAGERRLRAATRLGWKEIPAIVRDTDDRTMLTLAMVENLQRSDLDPIDEADGYQRLIDEFSATQQEVAEVVGKERSTVANALRLLSLPASVKRLLQERQLSVGHARALLPLETERAIAEMARTIVAESLSVREVEERVRSTRPTPARSGRKLKSSDSAAASTPAATAELRRLEELLRKRMQTTVNVRLTGKERGEVRIAFFSNDDLERVLAVLGIDSES